MGIGYHKSQIEFFVSKWLAASGEPLCIGVTLLNLWLIKNSFAGKIHSETGQGQGESDPRLNMQ